MDLSPDDRDLITRTVIGEAGHEPDDGQAAVAHVVLNRMRAGRYGGTDAPGVVLARGQFEPWSTRARELLSYDPDSPIYRKAAGIVDGAASGDISDPTGGATHFLNPDTVRTRRGGTLPAWASGPGLPIGNHTFYSPDDPSWTPPAAPPVAPDAPAAISGAVRGQSAPAGSPVARTAYTDDDVTDTLRATGLAPSTAPVAPPATSDVLDTMKLLGLKPSPNTPSAPPPATPDQYIGPDGRPHITVRPRVDAVQGVSAPVSGPAPGPDPLVSQVVQGMPIVGPLFNKGVAAANAGLQGILPAGAGAPPVAATFGDRYTANLDQLTQDQNTYAADNPVKSVVANLVGGGMMLGPLASTRLGGAALGTYGPSLGSRLLTGGLGGGAIGATDAALRGDSPGTGALLGAAGGVLGPLVGHAAQGATNWASNYLWPRVRGTLQRLNPVALNQLTAAFEGETPASLAAARARQGPAGFVGDLTTGGTDLLGGLADMPGAQKGVVREAYRQRAAAQRDRVDQALTDAAGPKFDINSYEKYLTETRATMADPLYKQWRSMEVHPTQKLKDIIPRLEEAGAFSMAEKLSGITGEPIDKTFFTTGANKRFPTAQTWDYVKQGLDSRIDQAYTAGDKTLARALVRLKNEMVTEIEKTPAGAVWNQARSEFADRSEIIDQLKAGRDTFLGNRSGLTVDELREELRTLRGPELAARIQGARAAAAEAMGDTTRGDTTLRNRLLAPNNQDKMRLLLGDDKAEQLIRAMEQEKFLGDQGQNVVGGSQTTPKKERVNALLPPPAPEWNPNFTQPLSLIPPHLRDELRPSSIFNAWRGQRYGTAANQLAPVLTTPGGPRQDAIVRDIMAEAQRRAAVGAGANRAGNALAGIVAGPGTTTARRRAFPDQP